MADRVVDIEEHRPNSSVLDKIERTLPPGEPAEQIKAILERDDAAEFLQSLDPPVFYRMIKGAGWDQSFDLIQYASPYQIQSFVDLDCWTRDRLVSKKMERWLAALVSEADDEHFQTVCRELDPEVLSIFFKSNLQVELMEEDEIPEHLDGKVEPSPDNQYALVYPDDEDTAALLRILIDRLYHVDRVLAWTLLEAARWELMSEMEEYAYKWRTSRLEEFGFVSREEALEVYQYVNPTNYRDKVESQGAAELVHIVTPESLELPPVLEEELTEEFYFMTILNRMTDQEAIQRIATQAVALTNRTMIADGIEPGELESGREVIRRSLGYLSLGLEFLGRGQDDVAERYLEDLPLKRIFQVGYSLTRKLQAKVESLRRRPTLSIVEGDEFSLLNEDERALVESLVRARPTFAWDASTYEIFQTQKQLDQAAFEVGMLAFKQLWLFAVAQQTVNGLAQLVYSEKTANDAISVSFDSLFATWIATYLASDAAEIRPLTLEEVRSLPDIFREAPWGDDPIGYFEPIVGEMLENMPVATNRLCTRWLDETLDRLDDEFEPVRQIDTPAIFQDRLLVAQESPDGR